MNGLSYAEIKFYVTVAILAQWRHQLRLWRKMMEFHHFLEFLHNFFFAFPKKSILLGGLKANSFLQTLKTDFNELTFTWRHKDAILKPEVAIFFVF